MDVDWFLWSCEGLGSTLVIWISFLNFGHHPKSGKDDKLKKQELLDELIAGDDYNPFDPSQRHLESRLWKGLPKDYANYNDHDLFNLLQYNPAEPEPATTNTSFDNKEDGEDNNCVSSKLHCHVESRL